MSLADIIFADSYLESFRNILSQNISSRDVEAQITIVAYLIRNLCREESHQTVMMESGILDALATRLASIAVAEGYVLPKAEVLSGIEGLGDYIPEPAISSRSLDEVLGAIAAIITGSPFRVCKLVYSPSILATFPNTNSGGSQYPRSPPDFIVLPALRPTRPREPGFMDLLLPATPSYPSGQRYTGGFSSHGHSSSRESPNTNGRPSSKLQTSLVSWTPPEENVTRNEDPDVADAESPLVPWLIHLVRTRKGSEVLMAASVLTSLFKAGFAYKAREASMGLLVVPVLMRLLGSAELKVKDHWRSRRGHDTTKELNIVEETPSVLARLITDSEPMQKAAFEGNAVTTLCHLLKSSYDTPLPTRPSPTWSPSGSSIDSQGDLRLECRLGDEGQHPQLIHRRRVRETALRALGALATFNEEYRKAIVDQEVMTYLIASLNHSPCSPDQSKDQDFSHHNSSGSSNEISEAEQNSVSVVVAACYTIRMLSRSVNALRTTLMDHSVWVPLFRLLPHPDIEVQIAATASICNLVPEFSPMREVSNTLWLARHYTNSQACSLWSTLAYSKSCVSMHILLIQT